MSEPIRRTSVPVEPGDRLMTPAEVGLIFKVDPKTAIRWCETSKSGKPPKLKSILTPGGHRRILWSSVRDHIRAAGIDPDTLR